MRRIDLRSIELL